MDLTEFIGFPKEEVLTMLDEKNIKYSIKEFEQNEFYDTLLLVKFEVIDGCLTLYFDRFKLNI